MLQHISKPFNVAAILLAAALLSACGGGKAPEQVAKAGQKGEINTLTEIKVNDAGDKTVVEIKGKAGLSPNVFKLTDPLRVIIDFTDTQLGEVASPIAVNNGVINEITASQFDDVSSSLSRIVIGFDALVDYEVTPQDSLITVSIPKTGAVAQPSTPAAPAPDQGSLYGNGQSGFSGQAPQTLAEALNDIPVDEISEPAQLATSLNDIVYNVTGDQTDVTIQGNGSIADYEDFVLENPKRLVVDLKGMKAAMKGKRNIKIAQGPVTGIRTGAHPDKIRIVMDFNAASAPNYQINKTNDGLGIVVAANLAAAPVDSAPAPEAATEPAAEAAPTEEVVDIASLPLEEIPVEGAPEVAAVTASDEALPEAETAPEMGSGAPFSVLSLDFVQISGNSRLIVKTNAPATYSTVEEGADTVILNLNRGSLSKSAARMLNTSSFNSPVNSIVPKQVGRDTRIVATLKETVPYKVTQEDNFLYVDFEKNKDYVATAPAAAPATGVPNVDEAPALAPGGETETPAAPPVDSMPAEAAKTAPELSSEEAFFNNQQAQPEEKNNYEYVKEGLLSDSMKQAGAKPGEFGDDMIFEGGGSSKMYTGRKINLDFKEADIRSLFRLFADISKLNIIVGDDVNGKVTIRLRDVPWDQAFAILLQTQSLGAIKYGNIIRVAPADKIQKERELHAQAKKAAIAAAPMDTLFKSVSYANATEIANHVRTVLSDRGTVNTDNRTNTIIIRDVREKLVEAKSLIDKLDAQTPQVTIEARIVEASDTFVRNWGVQWGGTANFSPATGNPTGLLFPNSVIASGSQSITPVTGGRNPVLLNYPATGANASVTLNLGSINNVLDLDLLLGYEESEGNAKLISSPKVTVLDNRPATILSGTKIPYITQTQNSGNNVRFESAVISIQVTPHITADGSVIMNVSASRNEPDFGQQVLGNPTIVQREATTEVLVKSGNTTVIGGIYRVNRSRNQSGFPFLRHVPVLGWFFSNDNRRLDRQELLIFITPRIVGDERTVVRQVQG